VASRTPYKKMRLIFALLAIPLCAQISVKDYGATGDGHTDDTPALQIALDTACESGAAVRVPAGTYNIASPLITKCSLAISGDGAATTAIVQTVHAKLNHAIIAPFPLALQDITLRTAPLKTDKAMVAVFRKDEIQPESGPALGQNFSFVRVHSSGFNFAIDIAGTGDTDTLGAVVVRDCDLAVSTEPRAVANPVNVRDAESLTVENSTLTGDGNNDHAIYLIGVRHVNIRNNTIRNHADSAVKLLTRGFRERACPSRHDDYTSWTVADNIIDSSKFALAAYTYCDVHLPALNISGNTITNIHDVNESDAAAMYIQATCRSVMENVALRNNVFRNISLSGVFLLSSIQGGRPCADLEARGTITKFMSTGDRFINFSTAYPGMYSAISANGPNVIRVSVSNLTADGQGNGRKALNLGSVANVQAIGTREMNLANRAAALSEAAITRLLLSLHFW